MSDPTSMLEGVWEMIRAELDSEIAPDLVTRQTVLEFYSDRYEVRYAGQVMDRGRFVHDVITTEKRIVMHGENGPNTGRMIPCLYQLAGDRLRICYGLDGVTPTRFTTQLGQRFYLATYRRTTHVRS